MDGGKIILGIFLISISIAAGIGGYVLSIVAGPDDPRLLPDNRIIYVVQERYNDVISRAVENGDGFDYAVSINSTDWDDRSLFYGNFRNIAIQKGWYVYGVRSKDNGLFSSDWKFSIVLPQDDIWELENMSLDPVKWLADNYDSNSPGKAPSGSYLTTANININQINNANSGIWVIIIVMSVFMLVIMATGIFTLLSD